MEKLYGDRYELQEKLGVGGMSEVWKAYDHSLRRQVAIKILSPELVSQDEFEARFAQEGELMARIQSPYAVSVFDRGRADGRPYIAMEYVDGDTLEDWIRERRPGTLKLLDGVIQAVETAHRGGIIHRDLKPNNILVGSDGRPQVIDFGVAEAEGDSWDRPGAIIGTAHYIAPEQVEGHLATESSDIYALGVILYQILSGNTPFTGAAQEIMAQKTISDPPRPPASKRIPRDEEAVAMWALQKDPGKRPASAEEMRQALFSSQKKSKAKSKVIWPWLLLGVVGVALFFFFSSDKKQMPNVVGMTVAQATSTLEKENIDYLLLSIPGRERGVVADTSPRAGENVSGQTVQLFVGTGEEKVAVPPLPKSLSKAQKLLEKLDLRWKVQEQASAQKKGEVIGSAPEEGTMVAAQAQITILVSSGKDLPTLPDFIGLSISEARNLAKQQGIAVSARGEENPAPENEVISQTPSPGSSANSVSLIYSLGQEPGPVPVPSVLGQSQSRAQNTLERLGFSVSVRIQQTTLPEEEGIVLRQSPLATKSLPAGSTITIWVGVLV